MELDEEVPVCQPNQETYVEAPWVWAEGGKDREKDLVELGFGYSDLPPLTPRSWSVGFESSGKSVDFSCPSTRFLVPFWGYGR